MLTLQDISAMLIRLLYLNVKYDLNVKTKQIAYAGIPSVCSCLTEGRREKLTST